MAWQTVLGSNDIWEFETTATGSDTYSDANGAYSGGVEAKFRMGFEYSSSDGRNSLQFNISLNLDDPFKDPGDGGAISFQSVF